MTSAPGTSTSGTSTSGTATSGTATSGVTRLATGPRRLSSSTRKATLVTHVASAVSWIGVDLALLVLAVTGLTSADPSTVAACYVAMKTFGVVLLLPLGLLTLASGLVLAGWSRWGILRYRWVVVKLVITVVLTPLVVVLLRPRLADAAAISATVAGSLPDRLDGIRVDLLFPPVVSITALLVATILSVYKPWGLTAYGRRLMERSKAAWREMAGQR